MKISSSHFRRSTFQLILILLFLSKASMLSGQPKLWSMTAGGGANQLGAIFKMNLDSTGYTRAFDFFAKYPGTAPVEKPILARNGKFYGTTQTGGLHGRGLVFSYDTATAMYHGIFNFDTVDWFNPNSVNITGALPNGGLIQATDGKLYGMTSAGGLNGRGTIYSIDTSSDLFTKLFDFDSAFGGNPAGSLVEASNGKMYGVTTTGGANQDGTIFSFDPSTNSGNKLFDFFNLIYGSQANGSLIQATDGKLYGMTRSGGYINNGVMFSYDINSNTYTDLIDFDYNDASKGSFPYGSVIQAANGKIYGMTSVGPGGTSGGVIFSFNPANNQYDSLHYFDCTNGCEPYGTLMQGLDGKLYGTTSQGGANNSGTVFSFDTSTSSYSKLIDLPYPLSGYLPNGGLIPDSAGNIFGYVFGGVMQNGVLFRYSISDTTLNIVINYGASDASSPGGSLVQAANGKLYGMARSGEFNRGMIFSFDPSSNTFTKVFDAGALPGQATGPGSLIAAPDGLLYGLGSYNDIGSTWHTVVFSFDPSLNSYNSLFDQSGADPASDFMLDTNGIFYGGYTDQYCCTSGELFSYNPSSHTFMLLHAFSNTDGQRASGSMVRGSTGKLYGVSSFGGMNGNGVIFSYDTDSSIFAKVFDFDQISGIDPNGDLVLAVNGLIYGMTQAGGANNAGVIFSFNPVDSTYTRVFDFDTLNGMTPLGGLFEASNGLLYGMTMSGGVYNQGVAFSFDISGNTFQKLRDFNEPDGTQPQFSNFIELADPLGIKQTSISTENIFSIYPNPASGEFTLRLHSKIKNGKSRLEIFNTLGKIVYAANLESNLKNISTHSLSKGVYFVKVWNDEMTPTRKLVVE